MQLNHSITHLNNLTLELKKDKTLYNKNVEQILLGVQERWGCTSVALNLEFSEKKLKIYIG